MPATAREPSADLSTPLPIGRQHRLLRARTCTPGNGPDHALRDGTEMMDQQGTALHGWRIAVAGLFLQMALGAVYAWSVFRTPLAVQFGWSIPEVTLTFNISIFVVGIAAFAGGLWMKSPRAACRRGQRDQSPPPPRRSTRSWGRLSRPAPWCRGIGTGPRVRERARALLTEADPSSAPGVDQGDTDQARRRESVADVSPVPHVPRRLEEVGLPVLVLEVVRVFPSIEHHQRDAGLRKVGLVVVDLRGEQAAADRLPDEGGPTGTHDRRRSLCELALEEVEAAEILDDGFREGPFRPRRALGCEVLPEQRMENVPGEVEGQRAFERGQAREIILHARLVELLERVVGPFHVAGVVFVVVQLHDVARYVRLESAVVVAQIRQRILVRHVLDPWQQLCHRAHATRSVTTMLPLKSGCRCGQRHDQEGR